MIDTRDTNRKSIESKFNCYIISRGIKVSVHNGEKFRPPYFQYLVGAPFISFSSPTNRWTNKGGGDRDEREAESRQDTPGRQLRHRQESSRGTDVQVHRQQASPQHLPALQSPQSYDQGKTGKYTVVVSFVIGCTHALFLSHRRFVLDTCQSQAVVFPLT